MSVYIIFQDGEMKGYLKDENSAKNAISKLADKLALQLEGGTDSQSPSNLRTTRETTKDGIKLYTQQLGTLFNGPVSLQHTITWKHVPVFGSD
jgi:hypothetical protein